MDSERVLFSGYARLPAGSVSSEVFRILGLVVVVDLEKGTILEAECTLSTSLSSRFVTNLLVGNSLCGDMAELIERINTIYQGTAKKAIIAALRIIAEKYALYIAGHPHS